MLSKLKTRVLRTKERGEWKRGGSREGGGEREGDKVVGMIAILAGVEGEQKGRWRDTCVDVIAGWEGQEAPWALCDFKVTRIEHMQGITASIKVSRPVFKARDAGRANRVPDGQCPWLQGGTRSGTSPFQGCFLKALLGYFQRRNFAMVHEELQTMQC